MDKAKALGFKHIEVIDCDLAASAAPGAQQREGFKQLLASAALGEVGIVLSRELSRLSRTDKDWCQLMELCQLFNTLIADADHLYDLNLLDDQLVLGIKGTLSVVELKVLKLRLLQGREERTRRGELIRLLAPGYVCDMDGNIVKDPKLRVQEAIEWVFKKFRELGSIRQTYRWFHEEHIELATIQMGAEVGLAPMAAMQNIAVINGRPTTWVDAMLRLVKRSEVYENIREEFQEETMTAICTVKRRGESAITRAFSQVDAVKAGLWKKEGPWQQYPRRMLQLRARSWALRDAFPDVLKGIYSREEIENEPMDKGQAQRVDDENTQDVRREMKTKSEQVKQKALEQFKANEFQLLIVLPRSEPG